MDSTKGNDPRTAAVVPREAPHVRSLHDHQPADDTVDPREYLDAIRRQWRVIAAVTIFAMVATALVTKLAMTKWYRAEAIIRPVSANAVQGRLSGLLGGLGRMGGLGASLLGNEASNPASEYMPVLQSFRFTTRLIANHGLKQYLDAQRRSFFGRSSPHPAWARYREMHKRFESEFSIRTGNLTLYYQDPNREMAEKVLGFYISDLRKLLRARQIRDSTEAIASLRAETRATDDSLLQTQLYEMLARQVQQQKLAQVEADFAFKVLVAPTTPDKPYRPKVLLDCILAGLLALTLAALAIVIKTSPE